MKQLLKSTIRKKMFFSFSIIIAINIIIAAIGYYNLTRINYIIGQGIPRTTNIMSLHDSGVSLEALEKNVDDFFVAGYAKYQLQAVQELEKMQKSAKILKTDVQEKIKPRVDELEERLFGLNDLVNILIFPEKITLSPMETNKGIIELYSQIDNLRKLQQEILLNISLNTQADFKAQKDVTASAAKQFLYLAILSTVASLLLAVYLSRLVVGPILKLGDAVRKISGKNLDVDIKIESTDETGELASAFGFMVQNLKKAKIEQEANIKQIDHTKVILEKKVGELEKFQKLTVDRELKMIELKKQIIELKESPGRK